MCYGYRSDPLQDPNQSVYSPLDREPDESRMVKKFRRAAAGIEEQLPSDLRPPHVLRATCDYLFEDVVGHAPELAKVHHFVWDRTRAVRNDFSIQQVTRPDELSIAVECYERIARFHILSLHQLALPQKPYDKYDWQQEREQLDRTLLSLVQYYDDARGRIPLPNESEFRAYCVIFQLRDPVPDLEDRLQTWPKEISLHPRVREAMLLYSAACNSIDMQGPLKPPTSHAIAQQAWYRFWRLVESKRTSYLMACVAEIYFNLIRRTVLQTLLKSTGSKIAMQWSIEEMRLMLALDDEGEVEDFCEKYDLHFKEDSGRLLLDFSLLRNRAFPEPKASSIKHVKTELVEQKRCGRNYPAIINGFSVHQARGRGMVKDEEMEAVMEEFDEGLEDGVDGDGGENGQQDEFNEEDSLFVPNTEERLKSTPLATTNPHNGDHEGHKLPSTFGRPSLPANLGGVNFGKPSVFDTPFASSQPATSRSDAPLAKPVGSMEPPPEKPKFDFLNGGKSGLSSQESKPLSTPQPRFDFGLPTPEGGFGQPSFHGASETKPLFKFDQPKDHDNPSTTVGSLPATIQSSDNSAKPTNGQFSMFGAPANTSPNNNPTSHNSPPANTPQISTSKPKEDLFSSSLAKPSFAPTSAPTLAPTFAPSFLQPPQDPFGRPSTTPDQSKPTETKPPPAASIFAGLTNGSNPTEVKPLPSASPFSGLSKKSNSTEVEPPPSASLFSGLSNLSKPLPTFDFAKVAQPPSSNNELAVPNGHTGRPERPGQSPMIETTEAPEAATSFPSSVTKPQCAEPDLNLILTRLAKELTLEPTFGFLDQYVDFTVSHVITEVQEQLHFERLNAEAKNFRVQVLALRYGTRWRDTCRRHRLAKHGRDRRRRAIQRLEEHRSQQSDGASFAGNESVFSDSRAGSVTGSSFGGIKKRQVTVDQMFQQSLNTGRWSRIAAANQQAGRRTSKQSSPSYGVDRDAAPRSIDRARLRNASHVDQNGRITKPAPANNQLVNILRKSSFLSATASPSRSTTKSNYFRRKALGIEPTSASTDARARKRQHSEMVGSSSDRSVLVSKISSPTTSAIAGTPFEDAGSSASPSGAKVLKTSEDDDALFARLRAAREGLMESASFFQSEIAKAGDLRRSHESEDWHESPSMASARQEARWRSLQSVADTGAVTNGPAYRMRESKFVPRENYGKAVERAQSIRESRSRDITRPASRAMHTTTDLFGADGIADSVHYAQMPELPSFPQTEALPEKPFAVSSVSASAQSPWSAAAPAVQSVTAEQATSRFAPRDNAFGAASVPEPQASHQKHEISRLATSGSALSRWQAEGGEDIHNHTIKPCQIPESLSASFGESTGPPQRFAQAGNSNSLHQSQPDSYLQTQNVSTEPDDESDEPETVNQYTSHPHANGFYPDPQPERLGESRTGFSSGYGHSNPYSVLESHTQHWSGSDDSDGDEEEGADSLGDNGSRVVVEEGEEYDSELDFDSENEGDTEDDGASGLGYDEDEEVEEEEEEDQEAPPGRRAGGYNVRLREPTPPLVNETLAAIGNTQDDAIELSD